MNTKEILQTNNLRNTASRAAILSIFSQRDVALSEPDIEESLTIPCDRVTIYRTLTTFLEKGIIHKVLDDTGVMKYALCSESCQNGDHQHDHVHFKCSHCGHTICIEGVSIPAIPLPQGYEMNEVNVLIQGVCEKCSG